MGRIPKAALLVLLLALSGVPGVALQLCAQSDGSPTHACCMGHEQMFDAAGRSSTAQARTASCCKVSPRQSMPIQAAWPSTGSNDGAYALQATAGGGVLSAPPARADRGASHLAKASGPPVRAMLCTLLI